MSETINSILNAGYGISVERVGSRIRLMLTRGTTSSSLAGVDAFVNGLGAADAKLQTLKATMDSAIVPLPSQVELDEAARLVELELAAKYPGLALVDVILVRPSG